MDEEKWPSVKEIFLDALEMDAESRAAFLDEVGAGDPSVRSEVESLIAAHGEIEDFIEEPVFRLDTAFEARNERGDLGGLTFGAYKIIREIGSGGMGAVYLAERSDGEFEQLVAVKIIRQAIAETEVVNRFKRERRILASLNHPNIAKLLDGGVSEDGQPFLAMEYVDGERITRFAAEHGLSVDDRLRLFLKVCKAVAFAHRNLIVHRDLKRSNILVTNDGEPKLLDFGLAKLVDENLVTDAARTETAFRVLTPAYASPEQLKNEPIATVSDIYSLGVLLFELLANELPFRFDGLNLGEVVKTVAENEPSLPSARPNAVQASKLRGDLDNIVMTALRKEPERRYRSVEALADDISRFLAGMPVTARPNTVRYRASKFVKRHKFGVLAVGLIVISLIGGIVASWRQTQIARVEKEKAERINAFLVQTLGYSNPITSSFRKTGRETTVNEVLDEAARRLNSGEFDAFPETRLELEHAVADTYFGQGKYEKARLHMERFVVLLRRLYGEDDPRMIVGSIEWAQLLFDKGELVESEGTYRRFLPSLRRERLAGRLSTAKLVSALNNFAYLRRTQGDSAEAESLFRESLELMPQLSDQERRQVATTRSTLASVLADQGKFGDALATAREAAREYELRGDTESPNYGFALTIFGGFLVEHGEFAEADARLKAAESIFRNSLDSGSLWLGDNLRNQSVSAYFQNRFSESIALADATLKIYESGFGKHYDNYPTALIAKGLSLTKSGEAAAGERLLREAVELRRSSLPPQHFWIAIANSALGECLVIEGKFDEAAPLLADSFELLKKSQGADNPRTLLAGSRLGQLSERTERKVLKRPETR